MKLKIKYEDVRAGLIKLYVHDFVENNQMEYFYIKKDFVPELYSKLRTILFSGLKDSLAFKTKLTDFKVSEAGILSFSVFYGEDDVDGVKEVEFLFKAIIGVEQTITQRN